MRRARGGSLVALLFVVVACGGAPVTRSNAASGDCGRQSAPHYTEYCIPTHADAMTVGPDGALWFTEREMVPNANISKVGRLFLDGKVTEYSVPSGSWYTSDIITGPDGALWFTGYSGAIGRITTSGVVSRYSTNTISGIVGLTAGPDGAVWFTDGINLDRVTPQGSVTARLGVYRGPMSITAGPDGVIWGTSNNGTVQRIDITRTTLQYQGVPRYPTIQYDLYHLPDSNGIITGPDKALWFTEDVSVGRITTAGTITEYPVSPNLEIGGEGGIGGENRQTSNIVVGPDGALWFVERGNHLGRITTSGAVTTYAIPSTPTFGITAGPDGAIWFPLLGNKIGRLAP